MKELDRKIKMPYGDLNSPGDIAELFISAKQLKFTDFMDAMFTQVIMEDVSFKGMNFTSAVFSGSTFTNVTFNSCLFNKADFGGCTFNNCKFITCNMRRSMFTDVSSTDSSIIDSSIVFATGNTPLLHNIIFEGEHPITVTASTMAIGCVQKPLDDWFKPINKSCPSNKRVCTKKLDKYLPAIRKVIVEMV